MRLSETIVDGVAVSQGATVPSPKNPQRNSKLKLLLISLAILIAVVLVVLGSILVASHDKKNNKPSQYLICGLPQNEHLLKDASSNLEPDELATLKPIVTDIQKLPNYQKDPNCDYVIVVYYLNFGNVSQASLYLSKLEQVYSPSYRYNKYIQPVAIPLASLKTEISRLQTANKQALDRSMLTTFKRKS